MEPAERRKEKPSLEVAVAVRNVSKIYNNKWCYCYTFEDWPPAEILISLTEKKKGKNETLILFFKF